MSCLNKKHLKININNNENDSLSNATDIHNNKIKVGRNIITKRNQNPINDNMPMATVSTPYLHKIRNNVFLNINNYNNNMDDEINIKLEDLILLEYYNSFK